MSVEEMSEEIAKRFSKGIPKVIAVKIGFLSEFLGIFLLMFSYESFPTVFQDFAFSLVVQGLSPEELFEFILELLFKFLP